MKMKILFVNPPGPDRAYGPYREDSCLGMRKGEYVLPSMLALLAGIARENGHQIKMYDAAAEDDWLQAGDKAYEWGPDIAVLNISAFLLHYDATESFRIKNKNPDAKVWGLVQPAEFDEYLTKAYAIDATIPQPRIESFAKMIGAEQIYARSAYDQLPMRKYGVTPIYSATMCPHRCIFCAWNKHPHRYRDPDDVEWEARYAWQQSAPRTVYFIDPNMLENREWATSFAKRIGGDFPWQIDARVDRRDLETLKTLKENGCKRITYGGGAAEPSLSKLGKAITEEQVREAIANCRRAGLEASVCFLFGFPWDSHQTADRLIAHIKSIPFDHDKDTVTVAPPFPFVSSELYGLVKDHLSYPDVHAMYAAQRYGIRQASFPTDHLTRDQVDQEVHRIMQDSTPLSFYLRHPSKAYLSKIPRYVARRLRIA